MIPARMAESRNLSKNVEDFVSTEESCTEMLQILQVAELKHVLKQFGYPVGGRKSVLQSRAMVILRLKGSSKVGAVIRQLPRISRKLDALKKVMATNVVQSTDPAAPCVCNVKFKETTFYMNIDTLVKPTLLVNSKKSRMCFKSINVKLTVSQVADLKLSESVGDDDKDKVFIHLSGGQKVTIEFPCDKIDRFCRALVAGDKLKRGAKDLLCQNVPDEPQEDCWPPSCDVGVKLNYDWYPITLSGEKTKSPVDVTPLFSASKLSTEVTLLIRWFNKSSNVKEFVYCVDMVKRRVIEDVAKTIPIVSAADTRAKIKTKLSAFTSNEISSSSQQISFHCPLSMSRLKDPCRGVNCKHLQCFDACSYLSLNKTKPRWICPVCQQKVPFSELEIDGLQLEILRHSTIVKIEFDNDGCWHPILNDDRKRILSVDDDDHMGSPLKKRCGDIIDLTDSPPNKIPTATATIVL